jgi:hypothetical protein
MSWRGESFFDYEYICEFEAVLEFIGSINLALLLFLFFIAFDTITAVKII